MMRRNRARTPVTVRASPAVAVDVSIAKYSEFTSAVAPCNVMLMAVGAVPKIVCQRTAWVWSASPAGSGIANCAPAVPLAGNASALKLNPTSPGNKESGGVVLL